MKIVVIGYGSMGRRRIRIVKKLLDDIEIICVDKSIERINQARNDGYIIFSEICEAIEYGAELAFVCTSPGMHSNIIIELLSSKIPVFTELNLVSTDYDKIIELSKKNGTPVFMSSTMLYDKQIIAIQELLKKTDKPVSYIYHVGQYLPDWHPWESYKNFFIGKKETNGCREILAIQFPWIIKTFGELEKYNWMRSKNSKLDIDFDDTYIINMRHTSGTTGVFVADVVSRKAVVSLEIINEDIHIVWNGTPETLFYYDTNLKKLTKIESYEKTECIEDYADVIIEEEYEDEVEAFFRLIEDHVQPKYDLNDDLYTLTIIDRIEGTK